MAEDKRQLLRLAGLGPQMVGSLAIGGLIGYFIDEWLETGPVFLIIFIVLGLTSGFLELYRALVSLEREEEKERNREGSD